MPFRTQPYTSALDQLLTTQQQTTPLSPSQAFEIKRCKVIRKPADEA